MPTATDVCRLSPEVASDNQLKVSFKAAIRRVIGSARKHAFEAKPQNPFEHHRELYRHRHKVDNMFGRLKNWRRIHTATTDARAPKRRSWSLQKETGPMRYSPCEISPPTTKITSFLVSGSLKTLAHVGGSNVRSRCVHGWNANVNRHKGRTLQMPPVAPLR